MFYESQVFKNYIDRLNKKIAEWKSHNIKLAIYGAGEHTDMILKRASWDGFTADCIIDRSVLRQRDGFCGFKVISPDAIKEMSLRAPSLLSLRAEGEAISVILISSFTYQEEIYSELMGMGLKGIDIIRLYTDDDILKSIKERYAYRPISDFGFRISDLKSQILNPKFQIPNSKLEILLIHPPFALGNQRHKKILPMNMLYLSAYVMAKFPDVNIEILDGQIKNLCLDEMFEKIMEKRRDIIGIGYWTAQAPIAFKLSKFIKENTNALLIHGGVYPTVCPEDAVNYCDYVVMYEGEETFCEIVEIIRGSGFGVRGSGLEVVKGIAYKSEIRNPKSEITINTPRNYIKDLDSIPFPRWELAGDIKQYNSPMHVTGGLRLPLIGSRGCPYTCTFCSSPLMWERKVRWRKPENIINEMEEAIKKLDINQFHFWDDNLMMKKGHIIELCNEIIRRGLKVNWCGLTRASHVLKHKDTLPLMKEAGCVGMEIGIESFTEDSAELVRKGEGIGEMAEASIELERAGIAPLYTHMLFNPGETINGYYQKQLFLNEVNSKNTAFLADSRLGQASTPHRKTDFEKEAKNLGEVFVSDLSHYIHQRINFIPHSLLNDVPVKTKQNRDSPIKFLEVVLQAIFDWTEEMIDNYVQTANLLWNKIDGKKSVSELAGEIKGLLNLSDYHSKMFVSLSIVGLAREGAIRSHNPTHSSSTNDKHYE